MTIEGSDRTEASVAKRSAAERVSGVSGASEKNIVSDRVAHLKRDCLQTERHPYFFLNDVALDLRS